MADKFYVYVFFNLDWNEPFYIGKGVANRINDNNRSMHVKAILANYNCERRIVVEHLDEDTALKIEKDLKRQLKKQGKPIIDGEIKGCSDSQRAGIERAKREGKYKGRKEIPIPQKFRQEYGRYLCREINKGQLAKIFNVSRPTLDNWIREYDKEFVCQKT